ncbi:discoidin domain-containing protein [Streptosporangium soli]
MRRSLSGLLALGLAGCLLAAASPATAVPDALGMPVFTGEDPVPAEPVAYHPRKMLEEIYRKEKGGDSYWIDRILTRPGDDPAGPWLMTRGRTVFMKEHDPAVIGFGGRVAYWESIDDRDAYTIALGTGLTEDVAKRAQMPSHWIGEYTGGGLAVQVKKFITHENVAVTTLAITNKGSSAVDVPVSVASPYAKEAAGERELTGVVTAKNRLTTVFPRLSGDGLKVSEGTLKGTLSIGPGRTVRTKVQMGFLTEELPGSRTEYDGYRGRSPEKALRRQLQDYNAWWAENLPYIDVPDENIKKFVYYRWWLMRFNYLDADIPGNDFQFPTSVEGALGYNNAIVLTVPMFVQDLKYLRNPIYSYGPWVSAGETSRNSKYTDNPGDPENWNNSYTQYISASALESYQIHGGQPAILRNLARYAEKDVYGQLNTYDSNKNGIIEYDWEAMTGNDADAVSFHYYDRANERAEGAYVYANAQAAAQAYELIGDTAKAAELRAVAQKIRTAVLDLLWDDQAKVFKHRDLQTGNLIPWKESNNYIPFNAGLVPADEPKYREALRLWSDPAEYPIFPTFTANQKDKAEAAAQGKPGSNNFSQLNSTRHFTLFSKALREYASPHITPEMYKQMLYWNAWAQYVGGDTRYPDANEFWADWNPATKTIGYRSWIHHTILGSSNWTVIEDVMGLRPRSDAKVELWPVDIGWDHFTVNNVKYRNSDLSIVWDKPGDGKTHYKGVPEGYSIYVDGKRKVTLATLAHSVWDPATGNVEGGTVQHNEKAAAMKAPAAVTLKGDRVEDLFQKAGVDLRSTTANLVTTATAAHGDASAAADGFTINEPHWSSKGSGNTQDHLDIDLGSPRPVDDVRLYFSNDRKDHSEPALYTLQYLDGQTWKTIPRQARTPAYPRANLNQVRFPSLVTQKIRILLTHRPGHATGLKEVQAYSTRSAPPTASNHAPYVLAVQDPAFNRPAQARLTAVVKDDALPAGELTTTWSLVDGPGDVFFTDPAGAAGTIASFTEAGTYKVRLTATDGAKTTTSTLTVTVGAPGGQVNIAPYATPTASYTSPWEKVTALNDGIDPPRSNDGANPRWGTWPQQGTQWVQLEWPAPVRVDKTDLYFFDDNGGVRVPSSWKIQHWDGDSFEDVTGATAYPTAVDTYNTASFDTVTTTRLRVQLEAGQGSLGLLEWKTYAVPPDDVRPVHVPTLAGKLPTLPATIETLYSDGHRGNTPVTWQPVTPDQVETGGTSFTVAGLAEGVRTTVQATVHVRTTGAVTITSIAEEPVKTRAGTPPSLPATVTATFNDGSKDSATPVTWAAVDPGDYSRPGTFDVAGQVTGTTIPAKAVVTVT